MTGHLTASQRGTKCHREGKPASFSCGRKGKDCDVADDKSTHGKGANNETNKTINLMFLIEDVNMNTTQHYQPSPVSRNSSPLPLEGGGMPPPGVSKLSVVGLSGKTSGLLSTSTRDWCCFFDPKSIFNPVDREGEIGQKMPVAFSNCFC